MTSEVSSAPVFYYSNRHQPTVSDHYLNSSLEEHPAARTCSLFLHSRSASKPVHMANLCDLRTVLQ